jgi:CRISPR-associated endoribonuclease Cas6
MVPNRRFRIQEGKMIIKSHQAHFFFSTLKDEIAIKLVEGLLEKPKVKIGSAEFIVSEIRVLEEKEIKEKGRFVTLSPINVTTAQDDGNGKLRIVDLYPDTPKFYENLKRNLIKKYTAFYGHEPEKDELKIKVMRAKAKRLRIKNTYHRCVEMVFEAEGSKELLEVGYKAGFGERNSMGFGMVKVV